MSGDPLTDKDAAEAFTETHKHKRGHSYQPALRVEATFREGQYGKKGGEPRCWGECTEHGRVTRWYQCDKPGKVRLADGSTWCGVHSPEAVAKRGRKQQERWDLERERREAKNRAYDDRLRREAAFPKLLEALRQIERGHNDPRALAREVLADWPEERRSDDAA